MIRARLLAVSTIAAVTLLFSACEGVPSLHFDDGGTDGGEASDAGDAQASDSAREAEPATCPTALPAGADGCCNTVPCVGNCDLAQCKAKNCDTCIAGQFCCTQQGNGRCMAPTDTTCK